MPRLTLTRRGFLRVAGSASVLALTPTLAACGQASPAIDAHGAGMHQRVVISSDGSEARKAVGNPKSPARWLVVGIVDELEPGVPV